MIFLFLATISALCIFEGIILIKEKKLKDIFIFFTSMALVTVFGIIYLSNTYRPSIASYILKLFKIKG